MLSHEVLDVWMTGSRVLEFGAKDLGACLVADFRICAASKGSGASHTALRMHLRCNGGTWSKQKQNLSGAFQPKFKSTSVF